MAEEELQDENQLEDALRAELGEEQDFLVDIVAVGLDAEELVKTKRGRAMMHGCLKDISAALEVLAIPDVAPEATQAALRKYQVAYKAFTTVTDALRNGRAAEKRIQMQ